jgi:hypothetical protein
MEGRREVPMTSLDLIGFGCGVAALIALLAYVGYGFLFL